MQIIKSTLALLIALVSFLMSANAQIRKIPATVTDALQSKYPKAEKVEWSDKVSYFVASFESKGDHIAAKFDSKGEWLGSQKMIEQNDLPKSVSESFEKSKFSEWEVLGVYRLYLPEDNTQFRLQVKKNDIEKRNLLFNEDGKLLKDSFTF